jgi:hypothetical protein
VQKIWFDLILEFTPALEASEQQRGRVAGRSYFRAALCVLGDGRLRSL